MTERKLGPVLRISGDVVRIDVPLREADDLPQIARDLEALAFKLKAIHQNEQLNNNAKLSEAEFALRAINRKLRREYPR